MCSTYPPPLSVPPHSSTSPLEFSLPHIFNTLPDSGRAALNPISDVFQSIANCFRARCLVNGVAEALACCADHVADCAEETAGEVAYCAVAANLLAGDEAGRGIGKSFNLKG
jgi:hypothetical protein